ncbi:unnamed protein product [Phytomonas sp. EM1]|nr:unnamed protein product [Phytomonas sp. EM1]|eukprot:CCW64595.1 unnamed protein product [Phytomonas sp. isolate EM1]
MSFHLSNKLGESVEVPMSVANKLFIMVANVNSIAAISGNPPQFDDTLELSSAAPEDSVPLTEDAEEGQNKSPNEGDMPLQLSNLDYSKEVLEKVVHYAMLPDDQRTANIPKPLIMPLKLLVQAHELDLVREAEEKQFLVQLLDIASYLRFEQLVALCAAYISERIGEIARGAPDIMTGSERIREFLHMDNEWTPEEMEHLRREMEYVKQVDPRIY